jgi:catalase
VLQGAGDEVKVDKSFVTTASILYDAIFVPGGQESVAALRQQGDALFFINEAFKHAKPIGATGEGIELLSAANLPDISLARQNGQGEVVSDRGVVTAWMGGGDAFYQEFIQAIAHHRHWNREQKEMVPA